MTDISQQKEPEEPKMPQKKLTKQQKELLHSWFPDETTMLEALKRDEAYTLREKEITDEIKSTMPDTPDAKLSFILPLFEEYLKKQIREDHDSETELRLGCIFTLFFDIYLEYRDKNGILQEQVDEVSDQWIAFQSPEEYLDYILEKFAAIRSLTLNPAKENILSLCVNMHDALLGYDALVIYESEQTLKKWKTTSQEVK